MTDKFSHINRLGMPVSLEVSINLNSLEIIYDELMHTIEVAATEFEAYTLNHAQHANLAAALEQTRQVSGVLRFIEIAGAENLAAQTEALLACLHSGDTEPKPAVLDTLTKAFVLLPRYLNYCKSHKSGLPILLIDQINEMRLTRRLAPLSERQFCAVKLPVDYQALAEGEPGALVDAENVSADVKRLRHMFQTGLLGLIRDEESVYPTELMERAANRLCKRLEGPKETAFWQMVSVLISAFARNGLQVTAFRKRVLANIEKQMRELVMKGAAALQQEMPKELIADIQFLLLINSHDDSEHQATLAALALDQLPFKDADLIEARSAMLGPSNDTYAAVIKVLRDEMRSAKEIIEIAAQEDSNIDASELDPLIEILKRMMDTLNMLNLEAGAEMVKADLEKVSQWRSLSEMPAPEQLINIADTMLFIDSLLSDIHSARANNAGAMSEQERQEVIARSQLSEATKIVIRESQNAVSLVKRAVVSYLEANNDVAHIANVEKTLNTVRGALSLLNMEQAATIIGHCMQFIRLRQQGSAKANSDEAMHSLADVLVSLEYYLNELEAQRKPDDNILKVAEESVNELVPLVAAS